MRLTLVDAVEQLLEPSESDSSVIKCSLDLTRGEAGVAQIELVLLFFDGTGRVEAQSFCLVAKVTLNKVDSFKGCQCSFWLSNLEH